MGKEMYSEFNFELAIKYLKGSASDLEKAEFDHWLNASDENRAHFNDFVKYWELTGKAFDNFNPDIEKAWNSVKNNTVENKKSQIRSVYRIAVSIIILISVGVGIRLYLHSGLYNQQDLIANIANDTIKEIRLEDGSVIWLNENSKLVVPIHFKKNERKVTLTGEAYFEIARNEKRPFIIESKNTVTEVLGTAFNIRAKENEPDVIVSVSTGKVAFYSSENKSTKVLLTPGMKGIWKEDTKSIISTSEKDLNYLAWKTGVLKFKDTPLTEVCSAISNKYNISINVNPLDAKEYLFTGNFDNVKVDQMLDIIATTLDIKFVKSNGQIHVKFK